MIPGPAGRADLPEPVRGTLDEFRDTFDLDLRLWVAEDEGRRVRVYPDGDEEGSDAGPEPSSIVEDVVPPSGPPLKLEIRAPLDDGSRALAGVLRSSVERNLEYAEEVRFFTYELSERYEEINLLYSISETLGSILHLDEAARRILGEVCDVMGARRGSLWVYQREADRLQVVASVGDDGPEGPIPSDDTDGITAQVFRKGRPLVGTGTTSDPRLHPDARAGEEPDTFLSVPIRYTPPTGEPRTVGVINLIGRRRGGNFTASDQKLLSAIASQVGAALENNRLIRESLTRERVEREMELAHDLQMKLLPAVEAVEGLRVGARVQPAESVGGDFYHLFRLGGGRVGAMIGDVSSHGFPAALIMALSMSAASIYASEFRDPALVIGHIDEALRDELETTEMYLTLFYGVLDPEDRSLVYANAGHPHAFLVHADGSRERLDATDPPVGITESHEFRHRRVTWSPEEDLVLLFTDGLSDALAAVDRRDGEEAVLDEVVRRREQEPCRIVEALFDRVASTTPAIPSDDRTGVVLRG